MLTTDRAEFDRVWPWLAESVHHGGDTHDRADIWALIEAGEAQLFVTPRAAAVTQVVRFPRKSIFDVWIVGGDLRDILFKLHPAGEAWAREHGLTEMWGGGRPGWGRVLQQLGYGATAVQVKKAML